jgi:hypothetical protein
MTTRSDDETWRPVTGEEFPSAVPVNAAPKVSESARNRSMLAVAIGLAGSAASSGKGFFGQFPDLFSDLLGLGLLCLSCYIGFRAFKDMLRKGELPAEESSTTSSIAERVDARCRSFFVSHVEPHLIDELSPEMLEQLREESLRRLLALPLVVLGILTVVNWLCRFADIAPLDGTAAVVVWVVLIGAVIMTFPATLRAPLDHEVKFRRQHGKWRWER